MSGEVLTYRLVLMAPETRVFAAVTEARHLVRWFCDECESESRVGGLLVMRWTRPGGSGEAFQARWIEWEPPDRAGFEGGHSGYPGGRAGVVRFVVEPVTGGGTVLRVAHELPAGDEHASFVPGWQGAWSRALERLERYLAPSEPGGLE